MMPISVKMSSWQEGQLLNGPRLLTAVGLRETLLDVFDHDQAKVNFVCRQVEETGAYELGGDNAFLVVIEKILHA